MRITVLTSLVPVGDHAYDPVADRIAAALKMQKHTAFVLAVDDPRQLIAGLTRRKPDLVFNVLEELGVAGLLELLGYRVAFVPFKGGKPAGPMEDYLIGFITNDEEVYGRPVGVALAADGALLVVDQPLNRVWRVAADR